MGSQRLLRAERSPLQGQTRPKGALSGEATASDRRLTTTGARMRLQTTEPALTVGYSKLIEILFTENYLF
ncbi:MAG: hypothetical protein AAFQ23_13770 [Cyanobacteria bacterium J06623_1]